MKRLIRLNFNEILSYRRSINDRVEEQWRHELKQIHVRSLFRLVRVEDGRSPVGRVYTRYRRKKKQRKRGMKIGRTLRRAWIRDIAFGCYIIVKTGKSVSLRRYLSFLDKLWFIADRKEYLKILDIKIQPDKFEAQLISDGNKEEKVHRTVEKYSRKRYKRIQHIGNHEESPENWQKCFGEQPLSISGANRLRQRAGKRVRKERG